MMALQRLGPGYPLSAMLEGVKTPAPAQERVLAGLTLDSRRVVPGGLFIACQGHHGHGLDHQATALRNGAAVILCEPGQDWPAARIEALQRETAVPLLRIDGLKHRVSGMAARFYGDPSQAMDVIGITGTNGKTSCSRFIAEAFGTGRPCGVIGTLGHGLLAELQQATHTTPDPVELQEILAGLRDRGAAAVAMEVSSHALDQGRAAAVRFDTAVLTNLSQDHLDYHGSMDAYATAKARLFQMAGLGRAVLNLDDPFGRELAFRSAGKVRLVGYGIGGFATDGLAAWLRATGVEPGPEGMRIEITGSWGAGELRTPLLGRFNASNLLAVLAVLLEHGVGLDDALARLATLRTVSGRMERFGGGDLPLVVVDYAHTPDALEQVLGALRAHVTGRLICVFGCGGDRDRGKRPLMGAIAERLADRVILTDDNPRSEEGGRIIAEIRAGLASPEATEVERNRAQAIRRAICEAESGDLVLIAGKGHEGYQLIGDLRLPFSDVEQVGAALREVAG